jgi:hypothetical protein
MRFSCRQCRALLPGYIRRELSPKQRAYVSRHLSVCTECYVFYKTQQQLEHELAFSVPRIGGTPRLEKMRAVVMAEIAQPAAKPKSQAKMYQARYSLAALVLMIALLFPWSIQNHSFALPTPPQPEKVTPQGTAVVAMLSTPEPATLTATLQSNHAPLPDGTDTP